MTANLFNEDDKPARRKSLQHKLLDYLRTGKPITEDMYRAEIGGKSVSAAIHNLKIRGHFNEGEVVLTDKVKDEEGFEIRAYRLAIVTPPPTEGSPNEGLEVLEEPEIGASDFAEEIGEDDSVPEPLPSPPEVSSIYVGVRGSDPELVVNFKGDGYMPLRHVMTQTEVRYLITNLMAFVNMPREEF